MLSLTCSLCVLELEIFNLNNKIPTHLKYSTDCIDLLSKLLKRRPSERIKHEQFFIHPFIDLPHAHCPQSINKAVKHITLGDELLEKGDIFDAYVNYKEGLIHLVSALQCGLSYN
nr:hypothetical transcript [Hymenolepis microstoma]